jgi:hypothetical protein
VSAFVLAGYFDVDRLGVSVVQNGSLEYDEEEFWEKKSDPDNAEIRQVGIGEDDIFWTEFTVANTSEREKAIIKGVIC